MQYKRLGRTGLQVGRPDLGTMNFGELTDETASFWPGPGGEAPQDLRLVECRANPADCGAS